MKVIVCAGVLLLGLVGTGGCAENAANDAQANAPDACTTSLVPALRGTIQDQAGASLVPDDVAVLAEDTLSEGGFQSCQILDSAGVASYSCFEEQPQQTTTDLPSQTYRLRVTLGTESWEQDVEVERASNCHVSTREFDLTIPPVGD